MFELFTDSDEVKYFELDFKKIPRVVAEEGRRKDTMRLFSS